MAVNPLSELNPDSRDWTVNVYVSRLWQHRGATDDGPIKHTDIVFQDTQGNHMYGEISQGLVNQFIQRVKEGKVYELKRFLVSHKKNLYRPVEGQFIIRFGKYTLVRELDGVVMDYPLCTYSLTPIDALPRPVDMPEMFTDVVGIITGVSQTSQYHSASRATPSTKRVIYLSDISGNQISVVLWGERATAFDGDGVLRIAEKRPVVAILVGTLVKPFEGRRGLSGGAPCRWYINEDLPEVNEIHAQLRDRIPVVQGISLPGQTAAEISAQVDLETKTVRELLDLDIWENPKARFYCTVTVKKLSPGQRWWYHACTTCNMGTVAFGSAYKCPEKNCDGTGAAPRYQICFMGADDTGEVEIVFFEKTGKELIGKTALTILRSRAPQGVTVEDAIQFGRTDQSTPREIAAVVSTKYRLVVSVTNKSFLPEAVDPSYQVHRIIAQYGKQARSSAVRPTAGLAMASSSGSGDGRPGLVFVPKGISDGGGLNSIGEALAEEAILGMVGSSPVATDVSGAPASTGMDVSGVGSEATLPQTPPSVVKPSGSSGAKDAGVDAIAVSSVQKALFHESPVHGTAEGALGLVGQDKSAELLLPTANDPGSQNESSLVVPLEKTSSRRRPLQSKSQVDSSSKKKKT